MINIFFLQHRRNFIPILEYFTNKIKPENKKLLKIFFLMTDNIPINIDNGIEYEVINFGGHQHINNYRDKFLWALKQDGEYFFKLDEDIILSNHVWDYIIENRDVVKNPNVMTLSPTINIGVPSVDLFIERFCPDNKNEIEQLFLQTDIQEAGHRWSTDLEHFNDFTLRATEWNREEFHKRLTETNIKLRGIHPIRFNGPAQALMMDIVLKNVYGFICPLKNPEMTIINCPYFVNDLCLYETEKIRQAEKDMGFDPYDEVPMNEWAFNNKLSHIYIKGAYSLHSYYAFVSGGQIRNKEQQIHDYILEKSKEIHHYELV